MKERVLKVERKMRKNMKVKKKREMGEYDKEREILIGKIARKGRKRKKE
jgi:hypothetical protein